MPRRKFSDINDIIYFKVGNNNNGKYLISYGAWL